MRTRLSDEQLRILRHELFGDPLDADPDGPAWSLPQHFPPLRSGDSSPTDWATLDLPMHCADIWNAAVKEGEGYAAGVEVPPMVVSGHGGRWVYKDGLVGSCSVWLDARHPFSKWLVKMKYASRYSRSKAQIYCATRCQSALRARMYGLGLARMLRRHRVPVLELTSRLD